MIVQTSAGEVIDLGTLETGATVSLTDYSRRETDDFGVTTVVPRGFSRKMSVRLGVDSDAVDALQRRLADLRATSALWVADDRFAWLGARGFYKDFSLDLSVPPLSYCTLTVEGLTETETVADAGGDPAPDGQASTLQLLQPVAITDAVLTATNVAEADYPLWSGGSTYAAGDRRVRAHRVYESIVAGNIGHDPTIDPTRWLDVGPTNRWAMFDQAVGTATSASGQIIVTLTVPSPITGLAALDVEATTVRVQAPAYDSTQPVVGGNVGFLDLNVAAGAAITVTLAGGTNTGPLPGAGIWNDARKWSDAAIWADTPPSGALTSVGSLLIGRLTGLGITEASPTAGITDYSRKDVDDFGTVTVVERAWSKTMSAKALIRTDALDIVANRIAAVRAQPSLWIGQAGLDSLTIYGFFKDVSIEVGEATSKLSLSIEGLSTAPPAPGAGLPAITVPWSGVIDDDGTRPAPNATNSADPSSPFGTGTVGEVDASIAAITARADDIQEMVDTIIAQGNGGQSAEALAAAVEAAQAARDITLAARDTATTKAASADGSATSSAGSATVATTKATEAGNSAAAAAGSAVTAQTAKNTALSAASSSEAFSVVSGEHAAAAQHQAELAAQIVDSATGTNNTVLIQQVDAASVSRDSALGQRASTLEAQMSGTAASALKSSIADVSQVSTTAIGAVAARTSTLEARAGTRPNLQRNGGFEDGTTGMTLLSPGGGVVDDTYGGRIFAWQRAGESVYLMAPINVVPGQTYTIGVDISVNTLGHPGQGVVIIDPSLWTGPNATGNATYDAFRFGKESPWDPNANGRVESTFTVPAGVNSIQLRIISNNTTGFPISMWVRRIKVELGATATAYTADATIIDQSARIEDARTTAVNAAGSAAQAQQDLSASYGDLNARLTTTSGVAATAAGRTGAYFGVLADAGNGVARLGVFADGYGGGILLSAPNIALDGNVLVTGSLGLSKIARNQFGVFTAGSWDAVAAGYGGNFTVPAGTTADLIVLTPGFIQDGGTFTISVALSMTTNQGQVTTYNYHQGKNLYTNYEGDGGVGVHVVNGTSAIGYGFAFSEYRVLQFANTLGLFNAVLKVDVHNGASDTGVIDQGDFYERFVSATHVVHGVDVQMRWTFN